MQSLPSGVIQTGNCASKGMSAGIRDIDGICTSTLDELFH